MYLPIPGLEGRYSISDAGHVRRDAPAQGTAAGNILKGKFDKNGYLIVALADNHGRKRTRRVHHLVAESFLGARPEGYEINHKDGIKTNNCVSNLEWMTHGDNMRHALRTGLNKLHGEDNPGAKLTAEKVRAIRMSSERTRELARQFGVSPTSITLIKAGKRWAHLSDS